MLPRSRSCGSLVAAGLLAALAGCVSGAPRRFSGVLLPGEGDGNLRLRGIHGTLDVAIPEGASIALFVHYKNLDLASRQYRIPYRKFSPPELAEKNRTVELPDEVYIVKWKLDPEEWEETLEGVPLESLDGLFFGPQEAHLPTSEEPWLIARVTGVITPNEDSRSIVHEAEIDGKSVPFLAPGANLFGIVKPGDILPFEDRVAVAGRMEDDTLVASTVALAPIGDPFLRFDPELPNVLSIGDSISLGYLPHLREALAGRFDVYHPPENGSFSGMGVLLIDSWLGGHELEGRHWDVIAFNHGLWDSIYRLSKHAYQANLEHIISRLKNTGAELIFVATTPVPKGRKPVAEQIPDGRLPALAAGVVERYVNPWALEVMARHPEIWISDQWQVVKGLEDTTYKGWWGQREVHFYGELNAPLARALARDVEEAMAHPRRRGALVVAPKTDLDFTGDLPP